MNPQRLTVNGVELNVVVEGEGPDVLLVHGFPDDHAVWRGQIPALVAAGYRVIAPDTRGCGESDIPQRTADYSIDRLVADLVGVLDALGVDRVRLVGHDWGAVQCWYLAMRHPERVLRYVAMSVGHPTAYAHGGFMQKIRGYYTFLIQFRHLIEFVVTRFDWLLARLFLGFPPEFPRVRSLLSRPGRLTAGFNYYRANLWRVLLQKGDRVTVPVVGLWSSRDRFLVERQMVQSAQFCDAGWEYVRVEGLNHWMQLEDPDLINALLLKHLA